MSQLTDKVVLEDAKFHTIKELELLERLAAKSIGPIANLGCFQGVSAAVLALASEQPVYSVDIYSWNSASVGLAQTLWRKLDVEVQACIGTTTEWASKLSHIRFGLVYIDAGHTYEACLADYLNWSPLVLPGGEVAFHDADAHEVQQVLSEVALDVVAEEGRIIVFEKW